MGRKEGGGEGCGSEGGVGKIGGGEGDGGEGGDGCKASVVSSIVIRRGGVKRVEVNMGQRAMSAKAER